LSKYTYKIPGGKVSQGEMLVDTFEDTMVIFKDVGLDKLLTAMSDMNKLVAGRKNETVPIPMDDYINALLLVAGSLGIQGGLHKLLATVLDITEERAALIPMAVVRSVIQDFFILNRAWLPIFLGFFRMGQQR